MGELQGPGIAWSAPLGLGWCQIPFTAAPAGWDGPGGAMRPPAATMPEGGLWRRGPNTFAAELALQRGLMGGGPPPGRPRASCPLAAIARAAAACTFA